MTHGSPGMRAAAGLHNVGVAENDTHALDRDSDQVRDHLCETRFVALPCRLGADDNVNPASGQDVDAGLLLRRADRGLDIVCETETEKLAAFLRIAPACLEAVPVGEPHGSVHVLGIASAVIDHA